MNLEIKEIAVMLRDGTDLVILRTDIPDGCWPFTGTTDFRTEVTKDHGINWVKRMFGDEVEPKIINTRIPK